MANELERHPNTAWFQLNLDTFPLCPLEPVTYPCACTAAGSLWRRSFTTQPSIAHHTPTPLPHCLQLLPNPRPLPSPHAHTCAQKCTFSLLHIPTAPVHTCPCTPRSLFSPLAHLRSHAQTYYASSPSPPHCFLHRSALVTNVLEKHPNAVVCGSKVCLMFLQNLNPGK